MIQTNLTNRSMQNHGFKQELSRVISAAVINRQFCAMLLNDPVKALSAGYSGENFSLAQEDRVRLGSIRANNLAEFAAQVAAL